ncbi:N-acetylmuramoyl-L-alanine amidase [Exiguobacterium sp. NG55]|uniref:N-acetylmuramoyl-L-alanine amidase n=1 Tax=Exiguobacterium sp. NG55 TaxID=375477 RepID=UPI0004DF611D|nr:N-acetylmuramoyl-L-alanine amidase [Exiguobacterium sp. NG55]
MANTQADEIEIGVDDGHGLAPLTPGKRTPFIQSIGRFIPENEFNRAVAAYLVKELKRCGFKVVETAPGDQDHSLESRVKRANDAKVDLFISIHFNAVDGKFDGPGKDPEGFSAHIDPSGGQSEVFAKIALKHLGKGTVQKNRGVVKQQLYVTANTKMPAVLFELGFMDNNREALLMIDKSFQQECAQEIAMAVCEYYGVTYKPEKETPQVVKPSGKQTKKGEAVMLRDVQAYARPEFGTQIPTIIKKGEKRNVYDAENGWYRLYGGEYIPSNYGKNFIYTPVKKDEPPEDTSQPPEEHKVNLRRVVVDGKRIGSFGDEENLERNVLQIFRTRKPTPLGVG